MDELEAVNISRANSSDFPDDDDAYRDSERDGFYTRLFLELFTLVCVLSLLANILIAYVILKYKRMREDATNMLLLNMAVLQILYFFCTPLTIRVFVDFGLVSTLGIRAFCIMNQLETCLLISIVFLFVLLVVDWFLKTYHPNTYARYRTHSKFLILLTHLMFVFLGSLTTHFCLRDHYMYYVTLLLFFQYLVFVAFIVVMNIVHCFMARKLPNNRMAKNVGLVVGNIFVICWTPSLSIYVVASLVTARAILQLFMILCLIFGFTSSVFTCVFLYMFDDNFNIFIKMIFRCQCNTYQNESMDDMSSVVYNENNGVEICENA